MRRGKRGTGKIGVGVVLALAASATAPIAEAARRPIADLGITIEASVAQIMPGDTFDYTLTVTNHGPDVSVNAIAEGQLPPGLTISGCATVVAADPTCTEFVIGELAVEQSVRIVISVVVPTDADRALVARALVADRRTRDPIRANDRARSVVQIVAG